MRTVQVGVHAAVELVRQVLVSQLKVEEVEIEGRQKCATFLWEFWKWLLG
jgi:hypothetical protein